MNEIRAIIINELDKIDLNLKNLFSTENVILEDLNNFICEKSKRIRSVLALLYIKAENRQVTDDILKLLTATELFHNASLLHDDVIDDSYIRRGKKTINSIYNSKIAILCGDFLISQAVKILQEIQKENITNSFLNTAKLMAKAEMEQYLNRNKLIPLETYLNIVEGKTAALFSCMFECLGILSNINSQNAIMFAKKFGIVFQINNDLKKESSKNAKVNGLCTIEKILGIEKTNILKDNYKQEMRDLLAYLPENKYKLNLEELVTGL